MYLFKKTAIAAAILFLFFSGCSGSSSSSGDSSDNNSNGKAKVTFSLKDAPEHSYSAVYVSVARVEVQKGGADSAWITVSAPNRTYNLLELVNGAKQVLGDEELEAGAYGQIRLHLAESPDSGRNILGQNHPYPNYVIDSGNETHKLKVPSGYQSGIKITGGFTVEENDFEILLDFDAARSVVQAGNSGQWILKPVIKSIVVSDSGKITGYVTDESGKPVAGIMVSAQKAGMLYPEVAASTETDGYGRYVIDVSAGDYALVVSGGSYITECDYISVSPDSHISRNFSVQAVYGGGIAGSFDIPALSSDSSVSIHVMMDSPCSGLSAIEVGTLNIINHGEGHIDLPEGSYMLYYINQETGISFSLWDIDITSGRYTSVIINR